MARPPIITPKHLTGERRKIYRALAIKMAENGTWDPVDTFLLEGLVEMIVRLRAFRSSNKTSGKAGQAITALNGAIARNMEKLRLTPKTRPSERGRGRPRKNEGGSPSAKQKKGWDKVLKVA